MLSVTLRSVTDDWIYRGRREPVALGDRSNGFTAALFSGGDSRITADPLTGLNKYLCPTAPAPDLVCASSCTASPISVHARDKAAKAFLDLAGAPSPRQRAQRLTTLADQIEARLLRYFGVDRLARVILCPSGTDAMLTAAMLLAAERPDEAMTAILPSASETGTGVPLAAMCRVFDGPDSGRSLTGRKVAAVEIRLRLADGSPRCPDEVSDAFANATKAAVGNVVLYLTHSTKTGLIAPASPPSDANVIVDACQARIAPQTVAGYLGRGWPVVVTGSKFFGGPAFSGAVLLPSARLAAIDQRNLPCAVREAAKPGTVLRWTAAMAEIDAFEKVADRAADVVSDRAAAIETALQANPALVPIGGLRSRDPGWAGKPSTFTFGMRDGMDRGRLLTAAELRSIHEHLSRHGVLLGQPVNLGTFGGLRIAIGARDITGQDDGGLERIFAELGELTLPSHRLGGAAPEVRA
jgi:hypothetical protein